MIIIEKEKQEIKIVDRKYIYISGVKKIHSLDEQRYLLDTTNGPMQILGLDLSMNELNLNKGILEVSGTIESLTYINSVKATKEKTKKYFGKLFK